MIILRLGLRLVLEDLWLHILVPLGVPVRLDLGNARSSVSDSIVATRGNEAAIKRIVVGTGQANIGCCVSIIIGAYMRCDEVFGVEIRFADFRRCLVTRVERSRTAEQYGED